jgi:hypothetical protein
MNEQTKKQSPLVRVDSSSFETLKRLAGDIPLGKYLKRLIEEKAEKELAR